jgi:hypothetical protein
LGQRYASVGEPYGECPRLACGAGEPDDGRLDRVRVADLQPRTGAAGLVGGGGAFGDDAFDSDPNELMP